MPAFYLYRGKLHRPSDAPREWPMPPRAITPRQFKILTEWRDRTLARLAQEQRKNEADARDGVDGATDADRRKEAAKEEGEGEDRRKEKGKDVVTEEGEKTEDPASAVEENSGKGSEMVVEAAPVESVSDVKMEESKSFGNVSDKQKRIEEVGKKLEALKKKKHDLVQILKQILNAEEEFKRRNAQAAALRASIPLQAENVVDMGSGTKNVPKLTVEVNFGSDSGAEFDSAAAHQSQGHHVHHLPSSSPSAGSSARPNHQNAPTPRTSLVATGHGSTSNILMASGAGAATSSPSRFAPTGHHGQHHYSILPAVAASGGHLVVSSLSPAASGGASSAFRDSRLTSSPSS